MSTLSMWHQRKVPCDYAKNSYYFNTFQSIGYGTEGGLWEENIWSDCSGEKNGVLSLGIFYDAIYFPKVPAMNCGFD